MATHGKTFPSRHILVQSQLWKHQNNVWNAFKVNNKENRTTSLTPFWCLCLLALNKFHKLFWCFYWKSKYRLSRPIFCVTDQFSSSCVLGNNYRNCVALSMFSEALLEPTKHLWWSFLAKIMNGLKLFTIFEKKKLHQGSKYTPDFWNTYPFNAWYPLKCFTYLIKPAAKACFFKNVWCFSRH